MTTSPRSPWYDVSVPSRCCSFCLHLGAQAQAKGQASRGRRNNRPRTLPTYDVHRQFSFQLMMRIALNPGTHDDTLGPLAVGESSKRDLHFAPVVSDYAPVVLGVPAISFFKLDLGRRIAAGTTQSSPMFSGRCTYLTSGMFAANWQIEQQGDAPVQLEERRILFSRQHLPGFRNPLLAQGRSLLVQRSHLLTRLSA